MADISSKQTIEGGALLDALSKLLFKGLDNIFDAASEYQKEMGVLKQVTKIPVKDGLGKEYNLIVKLSPIKDKNNMYYVEVDCPNNNKFKPGALHQSTITLSKDNLKQFNQTIDKILDRNGLERTEFRSKQSVNKYTDVYEFSFHSNDEDKKTYDVNINVESAKDYSEITVSVDSKPQLPKKFASRTVSFKDKHPNNTENKTNDESASDNNSGTEVLLGQALDDHMYRTCNLVVDDADMKEWDKFITWLDDIQTKDPNKPNKNNPSSDSSSSSDNNTSSEPDESADQQETSASIRVTLEKIVGSDNHEDINLVSIMSSTYTEDETMDIIESIVSSDEFVDSMPEGESSYCITECDEDYDIAQI